MIVLYRDAGSLGAAPGSSGGWGFRGRPGPLPTEKPSRPFCLKPVWRPLLSALGDAVARDFRDPRAFPVADAQNPGAEEPSGTAPPTLILQLGKPRPGERNGPSVSVLGPEACSHVSRQHRLPTVLGDSGLALPRWGRAGGGACGCGVGVVWAWRAGVGVAMVWLGVAVARGVAVTGWAWPWAWPGGRGQVGKPWFFPLNVRQSTCFARAPMLDF